MSHEIPSGRFKYLPLEKVIFGPGTFQELPDEAERIGGQRSMLVTTRSIVRSTPLVDRFRELLGGRLVAEFAEVRQHTPATVVAAIAEKAVASRINLFVSLGGGSVIDAVKAAALQLQTARIEIVPHIAVPTTLSASEFSPLFGVTDPESKVKHGGNEWSVTPRTVILDADVTVWTPDWLWLGSGMRALDHAVETIYAPDHQLVTDGTSSTAIELLRKYLRPAGAGGDSLLFRQHCQLAAWHSFFGVANITLGLSHLLGRQLGPRFNIPHGHTSAVLLPHVMTSLLPRTAVRQALISRAFGVLAEGSTDAQLGARAPASVSNFVRELGLPHRLRDLGVPREALTSLAESKDDVLQVLEAAW